jgi:hypothetical protein
MTQKILATSVLALLFAGCTNGTVSSSGSGSSGSRTPTAGAARVAGDLVPTRLVSLQIPKPTEEAVIQRSGALSPKKGIAIEQPPMEISAQDVHRLMQGDPATFTVMIDHPDGARVLVHAIDPSTPLRTVHLVDVATGARLDMARDETDQVNVGHVHAPDPSAVQPGGAGAAPDLRRPFPREQRDNGLSAPQNHIRVLSFDRPYAGGTVRIDVSREIAASGIFVEVQQPRSPISVAVVVDQLNHTFGETAELVATIRNGTTPVRGGTISADIELPTHAHVDLGHFSPRADGTYVAHIPLTHTEAEYAGVWNVRVRATGSAEGVGFERDVETALGYYPSHAHITALGAPVITRGADNKIDSITIDADVETLADDRFSVRGTLTYTGTDGIEHPIASAQTGAVVHAGNGTLTLKFDAESLALAGADGPFHLRDVALVSQAFGHTQFRIGRALDISTGHIGASEIRYPDQLSRKAQMLVANGDVPNRLK